MKKIFIYIFLLVTLYGYSCDCGSERSSYIEMFNSSDVIFQGKIVSIKSVHFEDALYKEAVFEVVNNFKGAKQKYVTIYTDNSDCALGIDKIGEDWIIWTYNWNGRITTDQCTASILTSEIDKYSLEQLIDYSKTEGYKVFYNRDGNKIGEGSFLNQKANGKWVYYIDNFITSFGSYKDGLKDGEWIYYYEPMLLPLTPECKFAFSEVYNSSNYKSSRQISVKGKYKDGKKDCIFYYYYFNGMPSSQKEYKNDILDGISINYFENGLPKTIYSYKNEKANGAFTDFNENGTLKMIRYYSDGQRKGDWEIFDNEGNLICRSNFNNIIYDANTDTFRRKE
ncbi:MAG: hypothetical protein GZ087_04115 [Flavobacterium sp.]|nr:hypothetical protein [Flavobacterium sp.]